MHSRERLFTFIILAAFIPLACQPLNPSDEDQDDPKLIFGPNEETVSHGYVEGVTPENIDPDDADRIYSVIRADWEGPGGDSRWLGMNLGAVQRPVSIDDESPESAGWYFKFNRKKGYQHSESGYSQVRYFRIEPDYFFPVGQYDSDWIRNNPCTELLGEEWRIPTEAEWMAASAAEADLNLHKGGIINGFNGFLFNYRGTRGNYWSATQFLSDGKAVYRGQYISIDDEGLVADSGHLLMSMGIPVRCIAD